MPFFSTGKSASLNDISKIKNVRRGSKDWIEMEKILKDPSLKQQFKKVIDSQFSSENLMFYDDYNEILGMKKDDAAKLNYLYDKYVSDTSDHELNLPYEIKSALKTARDSDSLSLEIFQPVLNEVLTMMYDNTYQVYANKNRKASHDSLTSNK